MKKFPRYEYDKESGSLMIYVRSGDIFDSDVDGNLVYDLDKDGSVLNIEILNCNLDSLEKKVKV